METPFPKKCAARFQHVKLLAQGGFGTVHLAVQVPLNRPVAVKLLHNDELVDADVVSRFLDEARVTASLSHPAIVRLIDHDVEDGTPWIAYEYLPGRSLLELLQAGPLPWKTVAAAGAQVAEGLREAHAQGVLHRDVKPANIMEAGPQIWKLTDFGLARWSRSARVLTQTGAVVGTIGYLAPELMYGAEPSPATDIFALGVTLHELVRGSHPYEGNIVKLLQLQSAGEGWLPLPSAHRAGLPPALDAALLTATSRDPADRFATAGDFARALRAALGPGDLSGSRKTPLVGEVRLAQPGTRSGPSDGAGHGKWRLAGALTLLGVGGMLAMQHGPEPVPAAPPIVVATPTTPSRLALSASAKTAILAALESDDRQFGIALKRAEMISDLLFNTLEGDFAEIKKQASDIVALDVAALDSLVPLESRLSPALRADELELETAVLAERFARNVFWRHVRLSRHRQLQQLMARMIVAGNDNVLGGSEFARGFESIGHEHTCLEPGRRWVQRMVTRYGLLDFTASDESVRHVIEGLDYTARYLCPSKWRPDGRAQWERTAAPLRAMLVKPGDPVRAALGALMAQRITLSWGAPKTPADQSAALRAKYADFARRYPGWPQSLVLLERVTSR